MTDRQERIVATGVRRPVDVYDPHNGTLSYSGWFLGWCTRQGDAVAMVEAQCGRVATVHYHLIQFTDVHCGRIK